MDVVDNNTRSRMMSSIRGRDTKPEMLVRRFLHRHGFRYGLHRKNLPGKPDLVMPKYGLVIFVNGCFWHRHKGCFYATIPASRQTFWLDKLTQNVNRDCRQRQELLEQGWRVLVVWECGLKLAFDRISEIIPLIEGDDAVMEWPELVLRTRSPTN